MLRRRHTAFMLLLATTAPAPTAPPIMPPAATPADTATILAKVTATTMTARLEAFSGLFFARPYATDSALGEGPTGVFDRNPLVRFDTFHCVSYLETIIALAAATKPAEFERNLQQLRYRGNRIDFDERTHFPELDWIPNGIRRGFFEDITAAVAGTFPLATASALIDRRAWYEFMTIDRIVRPDLSLEKRLLLLDKLHALGKKYKPVNGSLKYIPFTVLFPNSQLKAPEPKATPPPETDTAEERERLAPVNDELVRRIPSGAVVSIIRPNWNITKVIGTRMNVSHQGLLVWKDGVLLLRHAKPEPAHAVFQEPFLDYLRRAMMRRSVDGIHLLQLRASRR